MTNINNIVLDAIKRTQQIGTDFDINAVDQDVSLIEIGVLDSLAFVNVVLELEGLTNASVSLADIDPFEHTSLNGLISFFS